MKESRENIRKRVQELASLELDYTSLGNELDNFSSLAQKITGAKYSLINLLDENNQWTVASCDIEVRHMPKSDSVCQYTIQQKQAYEIQNLKKDDRFKNASYVSDGLELTYYLGIPIITSNDVVIGTICILDTESLEVDENKIEQLKLIASAIARQLEEKKKQQEYKDRINQLIGYVKKVAHDVRNPIAAIITTTHFISEEDDEKSQEELLDIICESAESLLDYTDDQLQSLLEQQSSKDKKTVFPDVVEKLQDLYQTQALYKNIDLNFHVESLLTDAPVPYTAGNLIHIIGNVISNSLKFTEENGEVSVQTIPYHSEKGRFIKVSVIDEGKGMNREQIQAIENGVSQKSSVDTSEEEGYGIGLCEALSTLKDIDGYYAIQSEIGEGTRFDLYFPASSLSMNPMLKVAN